MKTLYELACDLYNSFNPTYDYISDEDQIEDIGKIVVALDAQFEEGARASLDSLEDAVIGTCREMRKTWITVAEFKGLMVHCRNAVLMVHCRNAVARTANTRPGTPEGKKEQ